MSETPALLRPSSVDRDLAGRIDHLAVALTETEYHAAAILAFDPDAQMPAGHLVAGQDEARDRQLAGAVMGLREWRLLARACSPDVGRLDDMVCLAMFLAERSRPADVVLEPEIGARVRIRARQRIGGDRFAGREGVIVKTHFAGFYVKLDISPRERSQKTELVETAFLEVLAPTEAA
ncbi:hypothetical protein [Novosphingobium album (ex Liu et al. 2023)]|uniref:Uncharacterized protein n=1 Tax=Novosphingobium album (ex Liu et al. 2023) TaxID=3031130 RepID=A0ABT5WKL8_9SPHN|nr:hypothetical protein [Novosphingobium album (ex Liu et al. 2023)]MDE8650570.1 hypothetical protein [Novosphingobium album (ex Liu et al. 2023)]